MKTIKTFIIWLLLLSLPMQGFAAMSMVSSSTMSGAQSYSPPSDGAAHCESDAQPGTNDCSSSGMCALAAALAPTALGAAFHRPAASGPIPYAGAYAGRFFPDGLERPPHNTPS